jgi:ABC-type sugar transport system ATPase subunit
MRAGRIVQHGRPADLVERPADAFVAGFLRLGALVPVRGGAGAGGADTPLGRLPVRLTGRAEGSVVLVRPEAIHLAAGPGLVPVHARVVSVQAGAGGARLRLSLEGDDGTSHEARCVLEPGRTPPKAGPRRVWIDPARLRWLPTR